MYYDCGTLLAIKPPETVLFTIDPQSALPIWRQIEEGMQLLVGSGALGPGAAAPSVRELAKLLRVNPATVAKAYRRLTESGVLSVRRGEGSFVAEGAQRFEAIGRQQELDTAARRFSAVCGALGADRAEATRCLQRVWRERLGSSASGAGDKPGNDDSKRKGAGR